MAEAIARDLGHYAQSAGTTPGQSVAENAIEVLSDMGLDTSELEPKSVDSIDANGFDRIISMGCGVHCPALPIDEDWGLEDPHGKELEDYREIRDAINLNLSKISLS